MQEQAFTTAATVLPTLMDNKQFNKQYYQSKEYYESQQEQAENHHKTDIELSKNQHYEGMDLEKTLFKQGQEQAETHHKTDCTIAYDCLNQEMSQNEKFFLLQYKQAERHFYLNQYQSMLQHYKDTQLNYRFETREHLREELMQCLMRYDTMLLCTTLLLGSTFEFITQATPAIPDRVGNMNQIQQGIQVGAAFLFLFMSMYTTMIVQRRISKFEVFKSTRRSGFNEFQNEYCKQMGHLSKFFMVAGIFFIFLSCNVFARMSLERYDHQNEEDIPQENKFKLQFLTEQMTLPQISFVIFPSVGIMTMISLEAQEMYIEYFKIGPYCKDKQEETTNLNVKEMHMNEKEILDNMTRMFNKQEATQNSSDLGNNSKATNCSSFKKRSTPQFSEKENQDQYQSFNDVNKQKVMFDLNTKSRNENNKVSNSKIDVKGYTSVQKSMHSENEEYHNLERNFENIDQLINEENKMIKKIESNNEKLMNNQYSGYEPSNQLLIKGQDRFSKNKFYSCIDSEI